MKTVDGMPFQIIGLDLLIDTDLRVWLLDIIQIQSLNIYLNDRLGYLERKEMLQSDICQVDLYVKSRVVRDTILLANSGKIGGM